MLSRVWTVVCFFQNTYTKYIQYIVLKYAQLNKRESANGEISELFKLVKDKNQC